MSGRRPYARSERIAQALQRALADAIARELALKPGILVTITRVRLSEDLSQATVFVSVLPHTEASYALATLQHERAALQRVLARRVPLRTLPRLRFTHDDTARRADRVECILAALQEEREEGAS